MKRRVRAKHYTHCKKVLLKYYELGDDTPTALLLLEDLLKIKKSLISLHRYTFGYEQDHRSGIETYAFCTKDSKCLFDMEYILYQISYISDRFFCEFRLRWLLDLIVVLEKRKGSV